MSVSERYTAFCKTHIGASHEKRGLICQDSSFVVNGAEFVLAAVADGHGSAQYLRTDVGSEMAVRSAAHCVREFIENLENPAERLECEKERRVLFSQLWRSVVAKWHDSVEEHFRENPFTEDELQKIPERKFNYREKYLSGDFLRAYGTTLLFAVVTEDFAFAMQIGDGSVSALGDNGEAFDPVPGDERCYGCVTTSMCQDDAVLSGRFCYFGREEIPPAIFLGSDGVDDSYWDRELLHRFYKGLALILIESGLEEGKRQLEEFLPTLTKNGSGDDVSVAGIICPERLAAVQEALRSSVKEEGSSSAEQSQTEAATAAEKTDCKSELPSNGNTCDTNSDEQ